jgi:hypothetical protein
LESVRKVLPKSLLINTIGKIENIEADEYCYKNKSCIMEKNSRKGEGWFSWWGQWGMECQKGSISGSLIQKIWWWISRKEVKLKFVIEMDEAELDNFIREAIWREVEIPAEESLGDTKQGRKGSDKPSKSGGKQGGKAVRPSAKKDSKKGKKVQK